MVVKVCDPGIEGSEAEGSQIHCQPELQRKNLQTKFKQFWNELSRNKHKMKVQKEKLDYFIFTLSKLIVK